MAAVDTLLVRIEADMRGLRRDLQSVQRQTTNATQRMSQGFRNTQKSTIDLSGSLGRLKGILLGLGVAVFGRSVVKANAEMEDLRSTLSTVFGTAERGEAAFAFINNFAQRTPFDIQTLSRAFIQLRGAGIAPTEKMLTTLGNAASTTTDATRSFEAMVRLLQRSMGGGLGIEELEILQNAGLPVFTILEEKLNITRLEVSKFGQTTEGAAKITQALMDHFDSNSPDAMANRSKNLSVQLSNLGIAANNALLQMGDAGLNDAIKSLVAGLTEALQAAKPAIEAIGRGLAVGVKLLADNLKSATIALSAFLATIVLGKMITLTAAVIKLARSFIMLGGTMTLVNKLLRRTPLGILAAALAITAEKLGALEKIFEAFGMSIGSVSEELGKADENLKNFEKTMNSGSNATKKGTKDSKEFTDTLQKMKEQLQDTKLQLQGFSAEEVSAFRAAGVTDQVLPFSTGGQMGDAARVQGSVLQLEAAKEALKERTRAIESGKSAVADLVTEEQKLKQVLKDLQFAYNQGEISQNEFTEATKATEQAIFAQSESGKALIEGIGKLSSEISSGIANTITQSGEGLKSFKETFRSFINSILKQLIETRMQAILTSKALSFGGGGGGGGLGGFLSSLFGGGSTGTASNYFGYGNFGSFFGGFGYTGTSAPANRSFVVGERGPELFTPRASGMITPNNMMNMAMSGGQTLRGGASGPNITQNFNVTTGVQQTVRAEIMNLMPLIKQESVNAVINGRARGGSIANGLGA